MNIKEQNYSDVFIRVLDIYSLTSTLLNRISVEKYLV